MLYSRNFSPACAIWFYASRPEEERMASVDRRYEMIRGLRPLARGEPVRARFPHLSSFALVSDHHPPLDALCVNLPHLGVNQRGPFAR